MNNSLKKTKSFLSMMGIISSGKTTTAKLIENHFDYAFLPEKFDESPFMDDYYRDPKNWAFHAQLFFFLSKARRHKEELPKMFKDSKYKGIVDDSPLAQDGAYAYMHHKDGNMTEREWRLYNLAFDHRDTMYLPDLVIYLPTDEQLALERIKSRGREYEQNIQPEYLTSLNTSLLYAFERMPKMGIATAKFPTNDVNLAKNKKDQQTFLAFVDKEIAKLKI
jgi:deoxyadenosine/deoxycytidine kinase